MTVNAESFSDISFMQSGRSFSHCKIEKLDSSYETRISLLTLPSWGMFSRVWKKKKKTFVGVGCTSSNCSTSWDRRTAKSAGSPNRNGTLTDSGVLLISEIFLAFIFPNIMDYYLQTDRYSNCRLNRCQGPFGNSGTAFFLPPPFSSYFYFLFFFTYYAIYIPEGNWLDPSLRWASHPIQSDKRNHNNAGTLATIGSRDWQKTDFSARF